MLIKCWGARGGIPVSGQRYAIYGGDTPCLEIRDDSDTVLIIDAGTGIRSLGQSLLLDNSFKINMIFSHFHWDHVLGFPFLKPIYDSRFHLNIIDHVHFDVGVQTLLMKIMRPPFFPVMLKDLKAELSYQRVEWEFRLENFEVTTIPLSHPDGGIGFKFFHQDKVFVFLTDNELSFLHPGGKLFSDYVDFCQGADLLIHDAEYTEEEYVHTRGWGHSTYVDVGRLALEAGVKRLGLFHHNQVRSDAQMEKMVEDVESLLERYGAEISCFGVRQGMEMVL